MGQEKVRSFIAFDLDEPDILTKIGEIQKELTQTEARIRVVPLENLHITMSFLGEIPMSVVSQLMKRAAEIVQHLQAGVPSLQRELQQLEARRLDIETKLNASNLSQQRLANFQPEIGGQFQCPVCWVQDETRSALRPVSGTDTEDIFECRKCHFELSVPI